MLKLKGCYREDSSLLLLCRKDSTREVLAIQHIRFVVNRISRKFPLAWGIYGWTYYYLFRSQKAFSFSLFISF